MRGTNLSSSIKASPFFQAVLFNLLIFRFSDSHKPTKTSCQFTTSPAPMSSLRRQAAAPDSLTFAYAHSVRLSWTFYSAIWRCGIPRGCILRIAVASRKACFGLTSLRNLSSFHFETLPHLLCPSCSTESLLHTKDIISYFLRRWTWNRNTHSTL